MKILVIGSGGREHALVWKLAQSPRVAQIWCAPGNAGIACEQIASSGLRAQCMPLAAEDLDGLLAFARAQAIDLTVVGPDNPLAMGVVDLFQQEGLRIWGPNRRAAQFEASKAFAQEFMDRYGIPTARSGVFSEPSKAKAFAASLGGFCAVKADGLALGKGVLICSTLNEAETAIDQILVDRSFGVAGSKIVVQEFLRGIEVSIHALCDGKTAKLFPSSQDHKRVRDGDEGLNTGGMGAYSPTPFLDASQLKQVTEKILKPWIEGCAEEGIDYRGILYPGVMLTESGPKVLEFNARFGDPETQVYLPRLDGDLLDLLEASAGGTLGSHEIQWLPGSAVCVVMAAGGYPGSYKKGQPIQGLEAVAALPNVKVFHAGTKTQEKEIVTNGGRVMGVTAWAADLRVARAEAYHAVHAIEFEGAHWRTDIAAKGLKSAAT